MALTTNSWVLAVSPLINTPTALSPSWVFFNSAAFCCRNPATSLSRRLFLPSVSGIWDALTGGGNNPRDAVLAIRRGMLLFRQGDVHGSMAEFDKAIELDPRQKAYLWQRGLSLYYLDRFAEGAEQFRIDVEQNPNDTEESIWCFLCEAQLYGADEARKRFLEVGNGIINETVVREGNEAVLRARYEDAKFFYEVDNYLLQSTERGISSTPSCDDTQPSTENQGR